MSLLDPLPPKQFDAFAAARLLARAGFGGTWDEAERLARLGLDEAVNLLVDYPTKTPLPQPLAATLPESDHEFHKRIKDLPPPERQQLINERNRNEAAGIDALKIWWLDRMRNATPGNTEFHLLEEKLTLFWHSHFASSFADKIERCYPMWKQNQTFRAHGPGRFDALLRAIIRDPAMLVWLDNAQSHRDRPNENFARELMELFSTGVGQYSETDVKEAARALTGWSVDRNNWTFQFRKEMHDGDSKTFLGQTGNWSGDEVVRIICEHPATARFISAKLLDFFVSGSPPPELSEDAAKLYRNSHYDTRALLRHFFRSRFFYSEAASDAVVKSPIQLAIGALKCMRVGLPAAEVLLPALRLMGQDLFFPPDVNGWPGGRAWINSNTLLIRYNFANFLVHGVSPDEFKTFDPKAAGSGAKRRAFIEAQRNPRAIDWSPRKQLEEDGVLSRLATGTAIVAHFAREFLQRPISPDLRTQLMIFAETDAAGGKRTFSTNDPNFDERVRGLVHLIMSSPDFQLC